jgi:hypothetical protein
MNMTTNPAKEITDKMRKNTQCSLGSVSKNVHIHYRFIFFGGRKVDIQFPIVYSPKLTLVSIPNSYGRWSFLIMFEKQTLFEIGGKCSTH